MVCVVVTVLLALVNVAHGLRIAYHTGQGSGGGYPVMASAILTAILLALSATLAFGVVRIEHLAAGQRAPILLHVPDALPWILVVACVGVPVLHGAAIRRVVQIGEQGRTALNHRAG